MSSVAVIKRGSRQYRVTQGETLVVDFQKDKKEGDTLEFDEVLQLTDGEKVEIGTPTVPKAKVIAKVLRHVRDDKVTGLKYKRRKHSQNKFGHRQRYTVVEITQISH